MKGNDTTSLELDMKMLGSRTVNTSKLTIPSFWCFAFSPAGASPLYVAIDEAEWLSNGRFLEAVPLAGVREALLPASRVARSTRRRGVRLIGFSRDICFNNIYPVYILMYIQTPWRIWGKVCMRLWVSEERRGFGEDNGRREMGLDEHDDEH